MLTLEEVKVGKAEKVDQQIIDTFLRNSELLARMEFDNSVTPGQGSTLSYGYIQTKSASPAGKRAINEEYVPGEAKKEKKSIELEILGGSYQIDRVLDEAQPDEVAYQAEEKIKSTINEFHNEVINGNIAAGDKFDGLNELLKGADTEFESESDLTVESDASFKVQAAKLCEEINDVLSAMLEKPDFIIANSKVLNKLKTVAGAMGYLTHSEDAFGRQVSGFDGIPFLDLKDYVTANGSTPIVNVDVATGKGDIYFVRLSRDALCGVTINGDKIVSSHLPDFTEAKAVHTGDVEFVAGIALKNSRKAGVLRDVKVKEAVITLTEGNLDENNAWDETIVNSYKATLEQGNVIKIKGLVPYVAEPKLGVPAGNVVAFNLAHLGITSTSQLPSGTIFKVYDKDGAVREGTKSAFETDGSAVLYTSVYGDFVKKFEITWVSGKKEVYTIDVSEATLEENA